ncbi:MAG: DEAD/DEAH box helicase [Spirochaetota bacterium]
MQFTDFKLDERLLHAVQKLDYSTPTPIQEKAIPICLDGHDLIGTAATGTGKTAAFVLPILHRLITNHAEHRSPRVLIVTPTRELAEQIRMVVKGLSHGTHIRSASVYGGVGFDDQRRALTNGTEIIVACPGRLLDHMQRMKVDLTHVETVVLDEADRMLDMGFLPDIKRILDALPRERQTLLFSATFAKELMDLVHHYLRHPKRISVDTEKPAETVDHCFYPVRQHLKTPLLISLLKTTEHRSILIFTRTKHRANRLKDNLERAGFAAGVLHSNKSQNQRRQAMDGFRSGRLAMLVATDIVARGIDINTISHVVNYDIPDTAVNYIHRIGRTGRAAREGDAITFITPEDNAEVREIERRLGKRVERRELPGFNYNAEPPPASERMSYGTGHQQGRQGHNGGGRGGRSDFPRGGHAGNRTHTGSGHGRPPAGTHAQGGHDRPAHDAQPKTNDHGGIGTRGLHGGYGGQGHRKPGKRPHGRNRRFR